jgi:hypothetical protein
MSAAGRSPSPKGAVARDCARPTLERRMFDKLVQGGSA